MKARVIIEYDLLPGDCVVIRDREEQRWTACKTVLALAGSATVKVELLEVTVDARRSSADHSRRRGGRALNLPDIR
jgi:hypothetical protein